LLRVRALSLVFSAPEKFRDLTCHPFDYLSEICQLASDGRDVFLCRQGAPILRRGFNTHQEGRGFVEQRLAVRLDWSKVPTWRSD
jgi:hypothetical protein